MIYQALKSILKLSLRVYFKHIEVVGLENIPKDQPSIFFGNHPNSLLDPAMICTHAQRDICFAAKDTLFANAFVNQFLTTLKAIPIKRKMDHQDQSAIDNQNAFDRLNEALIKGNAMGIFPEGISHNESQIAQLKTGTARIAFSFIKSQKSHLFLNPCGLYYQSPGQFRTAAFVQFAPPFLLMPTLDQHWILYRFEPQEDQQCSFEQFNKLEWVEEGGSVGSGAKIEVSAQEEVKWLTQKLDTALRSITVNAESWDTIKLLDMVRRLYQPGRIRLEQKVELNRRFNQVYPSIAQEAELKALTQEIKEYQEDLYDLGLSDRQIQLKHQRLLLLYRGLSQLVLCCIWFPIALLTSFVHIPMGILIKYGAFTLAPRKDVIATTKFLMGFVLVNGIYLMISIILAYLYHPIYLLITPIALILSGYATLKLVEGWSAFKRTGWIFITCFFAKNYINRLKQRRAILRQKILDAVDRYMPKEMKRLFYGDQSEIKD